MFRIACPSSLAFPLPTCRLPINFHLFWHSINHWSSSRTVNRRAVCSAQRILGIRPVAPAANTTCLRFIWNWPVLLFTLVKQLKCLFDYWAANCGAFEARLVAPPLAPNDTDADYCDDLGDDHHCGVITTSTRSSK